MDCMISFNGHSYFVKEKEFFNAQVEDSKKNDPNTDWFKHWKPIYDVDGIEHARDRAKLTWGDKGQRWNK